MLSKYLKTPTCTRKRTIVLEYILLSLVVSLNMKDSPGSFKTNFLDNREARNRLNSNNNYINVFYTGLCFLEYLPTD